MIPFILITPKVKKFYAIKNPLAQSTGRLVLGVEKFDANAGKNLTYANETTEFLTD